MAVNREANWLGNQRVDIPHLRGVESAVRGDFDLLAGVMIAGRAPLITSGFYVITAGITVATNLKLRVADSTLIHFLASESGSIFHVPADRADEQLNTTNPRIIGGFTPSQVNYVGLDFVREADDTTADRVQFIDTNSLQETPVTVPLSRTTDYRIVISTLDFDNNPGIAPICKVTVDSAGNITAISDAREQAFRLGSGGTVPDITHSFPWPSGRSENTSGDVFVGGDKAISSFKGWMDSVMSRLWEVGGGEYWYSPTNNSNEHLSRTGAAFVSNGEYFEWDGTNLHWQGLVWVFANSTAVYNTIANQTSDSAGLTDLADGECIYVDVDRTSNAALNAAKGTLTELGSPEMPGSRFVLAWRYGANIFTRDQSYYVGASLKLATFTTSGTSMLSADVLGVGGDPRVVAVDSLDKGYASGLTRGAPGAGVTDGAGTLTIGGGTYDTAIDIRNGTAGPASLRSDEDDLTLLAFHGNVSIAAPAVSVGQGDIEIVAGNELILETSGFTAMRFNGSYFVNDCGSLSGQSAASTCTFLSNFISLSGATAVNYITTTGWEPSSIIRLRLASGVTINHNAGSVPANTASILLNANANVTTSNANKLLSLFYDGTNWVEIGPIS